MINDIILTTGIGLSIILVSLLLLLFIFKSIFYMAEYIKDRTGYDIITWAVSLIVMMGIIVFLLLIAYKVGLIIMESLV